MSSLLYNLDRGRIHAWKVFWVLVAFEAAIMTTLIYGDFVHYGTLIFYAYFVGIFVTPLLLLLIPIEPTIGILLMLLTTGFDFLARITKSSGGVNFNFTYFHLALLVTIISTFLNLVLRRRTVIHSIDLWPPFILFLFVLSYSLIYTPNFPDGAMTFVRVVVMGFISLIVIECVDKAWKVSLVMWGMVFIPVGISLLTIYQLTTEGAIYSPNVTKMATSLGIAVFRSTGTFDNPNKLACFLMIGIVIPFGMMFIKVLHPWLKYLLLGSLFLSSLGILTTFSRAGWLSTLVGLVFIVALNKKWSFFYIFLGLVVLMMVVVSIKIPQLWEVIFDRFGSIFDPSSDDSSSSRVSLAKSAIWMWQDSPLFGVGLRGYPELYYDYLDPNMPHILIEVNEPHTLQVEILAEEGLIGFVVGAWLFMTVLVHGIRTSLRLKLQNLRAMQIATTALMIGFIVNFTFATDLTNNSFWITVGLIYAIPIVDSIISENKEENTIDPAPLPDTA